MRRHESWLVLLLLLSSGVLVVSACGTRTRETPTVEPADVAVPPSSLPIPSLPYTLRQGKVLFLHYCATCHGVEGHGDGFNAYSLDPKPRDLADPIFHQTRSDEDLIAVIRTGGGAIGLSTAMPPWGSTLNARQIGQLVLFLRGLPQDAESADAEGTP